MTLQILKQYKSRLHIIQQLPFSPTTDYIALKNGQWFK